MFLPRFSLLFCMMVMCSLASVVQAATAVLDLHGSVSQFGIRFVPSEPSSSDQPIASQKVVNVESQGSNSVDYVLGIHQPKTTMAVALQKVDAVGSSVAVSQKVGQLVLSPQSARSPEDTVMLEVLAK